MRKHLAESLPGLTVRGHGDDVRRRMVDQQPHQLRAGVAAGADNGDAEAIAYACNRCQSRLLAMPSPSRCRGSLPLKGDLPRERVRVRGQMGSALGELEAAARLRLAVLLALDHARIACQESAAFSVGRSAGSKRVSARLMPCRSAPAWPERPPPVTVHRTSYWPARLVATNG